MGRIATMVVAALAFPILLGGQERTAPVSGKNYAEGLGRIWVQRALQNAVARLEKPGCRQLFSDFSDAQGVPIVQKLESLGVTAEEYLTRWIWFMEGSRQRQCRNRDITAFTQPGSRVIYVCSSRVVANDTPYGDVVIIHEMLHSLGLRENPPTSKEITKRVLERCKR